MLDNEALTAAHAALTSKEEGEEASGEKRGGDEFEEGEEETSTDEEQQEGNGSIDSNDDNNPEPHGEASKKDSTNKSAQPLDAVVHAHARCTVVQEAESALDRLNSWARRCFSRLAGQCSCP